MADGEHWWDEDDLDRNTRKAADSPGEKGFLDYRPPAKAARR